MKNLVLLLLFLTLCYCQEENDRHCEKSKPVIPRLHTVAITEFGAVGDGKTLNTLAFQNAIFYLQSFCDKGGAQLYVPPGRWLTGSLNLTSYMTLYLDRDAVILGSQDYEHWEVVQPLPSYGRGIDLPGWRYSSLLTGYNLTDVVITGDNGIIDGQGSFWWEAYNKHYLNDSRPHLLEFVDSSNIVIANITFLNSPAWSIHPIYCSEVLIENITVSTPPESPYTSGIVPDSSVSMCIRYCNVSTSYDAIVLKSGWDEYGIAYAKPTINIHLKSLHLQSSMGSGVAFGSEMSGGIATVLVEQIHLHDSHIGIELKTAKGRGGFLQDISILEAEMRNVAVAFKVTGDFGIHPDSGYNPNAFPIVQDIKFTNVIGQNITMAGVFSGIHESPFTWFILSNITFEIRPMEPSGRSFWVCSDVFGTSDRVLPEPCPDLQVMSLNTSSFSIVNPVKEVAAL
ncbi:putative polygalacturonase [Silene latifolia]|uniref:putative polygalacturonase n=1 Tax=Silene latifolia TaxID=37657 RepID=UPI003D7731EB